MPASPLKIFISSVQKELAEERRAVKTFIENDSLLRRRHGLAWLADAGDPGRI